LVNHAQPTDVTEGYCYAADWTIGQLRVHRRPPWPNHSRLSSSIPSGSRSPRDRELDQPRADGVEARVGKLGLLMIRRHHDHTPASFGMAVF
ncbi:MAG: hypothetical protein OXP69_11915, partial [Spirochaetaceae bacterium]|nr:hypothetical protein [Spirochaetaceae bacterium]